MIGSRNWRRKRTAMLSAFKMLNGGGGAMEGEGHIFNKVISFDHFVSKMWFNMMLRACGQENIWGKCSLWTSLVPLGPQCISFLTSTRERLSIPLTISLTFPHVVIVSRYKSFIAPDLNTSLVNIDLFWLNNTIGWRVQFGTLNSWRKMKI